MISSIKALKNSSGNCSVCLKVGTGKEFRSLVSLNLVYRAGDKVRGYSTRSVVLDFASCTLTSVLLVPFSDLIGFKVVLDFWWSLPNEEL